MTGLGRDVAEPGLILVLIVAVWALAAWADRRAARRTTPRHLTGSTGLVPDRDRLLPGPPDGWPYEDDPGGVRAYLLDVAREADRGRPLPPGVIEAARRATAVRGAS